MKFKDVAEEWYSNKMVTMSYCYQREIEGIIKHLIGEFGENEIASIKSSQIDKLITKLAIRNPNTGKPSSKRTLRDLIHTLSAIFEDAIENDYVLKNPAKGKKPPKNSPKKTRRALTDSEKELILSVVHRAQTPAMIMMFAGLRVGEVIPLQWCDIDFNEKIITINKSAAKIAPNVYAVKPGTKNGKSRMVNMPEYLVNYLKFAMSKAESTYVTCKRDGKLHTPSTWKSLWLSYQNELNFCVAPDKSRSKFHPGGIPKTVDNITAHMLRHTYATMLFNADVDVKTAAKLLGHSNIKTTLEIYTHLEENKKIKSINNFDRYIEENFGKVL